MKFIAATSTATAIKLATGGPPPPPPATGADTCENGPGVDKLGDDCGRYDSHPEDCGWYDTDTWSSLDVCCACKGKPAPDKNAVDETDCQETLEDFYMMFEGLDRDGNGSISAAEAMIEGITLEELEEFGGVDMNDDGGFSMAELDSIVDEDKMKLLETYYLDYYGCEVGDY